MTYENSDDAALDAALIAAHEAGQTIELITLYTRAADRLEAKDETDAACFMLTQAYVFALDAGDDRAGVLRTRLVAHGRETDGD